MLKNIRDILILVAPLSIIIWALWTIQLLVPFIGTIVIILLLCGYVILWSDAYKRIFKGGNR